MARRKFLQDLDRVKTYPPSCITEVRRYDGDGVSFTFHHYLNNAANTSMQLKLITTNVDQYPDDNQFIFFTEDVDVDPRIASTLEHIQATLDGASLPTAIRQISTSLTDALTLGLEENPIELDSSSQAPQIVDTEESSEDEEDEECDDDDDDSFGLVDMAHGSRAQPVSGVSARDFSFADSEAIRPDLVAAKAAGFRVGVHGDLTHSGIACISIRTTKLGISEEAMRAWGLTRQDYLVLMIRFLRGYKSLKQVKENQALNGEVEVRVGLCNSYKPRAAEAFSAFDDVQTETSSQPERCAAQSQTTCLDGSLKPLFIARPLNSLLRERFTKIVRFREDFGLAWHGAERLFNDRQGALIGDLYSNLTVYQGPEKVTFAHKLPSIVTADELATQQASEASFPLVAMQFVLRHFVRCTEFCLVCHCSVENTFEALKPYVCSNPLCLYQFLALGFGPAAEWEIISQPFVVDLLVSLCYMQARHLKIKELPVGMSLKVPILPHYKNATNPTYGNAYHHNPNRHNATVTKETPPKSNKVFKAKFDSDTSMLSSVFRLGEMDCQDLRRGDWMVLISENALKATRHCRISDVQSNERGIAFFLDPVIQIADNVAVGGSARPKRTEPSMADMDCYLYDSNFDELPNLYQQQIITSLLDTLPSITSIRKALVQQQGVGRDPNLNELRNQCPSVALDLLRWVIASNRSCIVQVDDVAIGDDNSKKLVPSEDRVSGMDDWMQFRFAQGAPDKEQRFVDCVKAKSSSVQHPTLFAWHGSPIHNWHSIIRQGLNFDEIAHGRASGNGVYMSPHLHTSMGYSGGPYSHNGASLTWSNSILKLSSVVSLQEIVNAPQSFVSSSPHFVVAEKDWIQTRYLFVKASVRHASGSSAKIIYQQDPKHTVRGSSNTPVSIPITAISKSRRPAEAHSSSSDSKKRKLTVPKSTCADDMISVATDEDDRDLLSFDDDDDGPLEYDSDDVVMIDSDSMSQNSIKQLLPRSSHQKSKKRILESYILDSTKTDFVPGGLDLTGIRFLDPPLDATPGSTKALMKAFNETLRVQETTALHELGFYLDRDRMENMYQWIVELHSFDKSLPLARDMESAGITSIVFEMQFTNDFPFSPPFVRVVKPRFLDPMSGGGGHITSGGAICMELLTSSGWSAVNSIESVLLQVRLAMSEQERPARLLHCRGKYDTTPYPIGEAIAAYRRFCQKHGWQEPSGLDRLRAT